MTDYHCENCEFFENRSTDKLIDGYCKKYNQSLNFYDWWEKCDKCIEEGKMTELEYLKQQEEKNAEAALRENARLEAEVERLKAENAALCERLEKAVELPFDHKYADFHIEPYFGEIKPSLVDNGAKVVIPMYVYFKFNSVEEAKSWLTKQQAGEEG